MCTNASKIAHVDAGFQCRSLCIFLSVCPGVRNHWKLIFLLSIWIALIFHQASGIFARWNLSSTLTRLRYKGLLKIEIKIFPFIYFTLVSRGFQMLARNILRKVSDTKFILYGSQYGQYIIVLFHVFPAFVFWRRYENLIWNSASCLLIYS